MLRARADLLDLRWAPPLWRAERDRGGAGGAARGAQCRPQNFARRSDCLVLIADVVDDYC
eukprot:3084449-Pyramimonas_sp.AAC.1